MFLVVCNFRTACLVVLTVVVVFATLCLVFLAVVVILAPAVVVVFERRGLLCSCYAGVTNTSGLAGVVIIDILVILS